VQELEEEMEASIHDIFSVVLLWQRNKLHSVIEKSVRLNYNIITLITRMWNSCVAKDKANKIYHYHGNL
jgi:hypothetical protein